MVKVTTEQPTYYGPKRAVAKTVEIPKWDKGGIMQGQTPGNADQPKPDYWPEVTEE